MSCTYVHTKERHIQLYDQEIYFEALDRFWLYTVSVFGLSVRLLWGYSDGIL